MKQEKLSKRREDLITEVAAYIGATKKDTRIFMQGFEDVVVEMLKAGYDVNMSGFGGFKLRKLKERAVIHPQTKEYMNVKAKIVCRFEAGKKVKDAVKDLDPSIRK